MRRLLLAPAILALGLPAGNASAAPPVGCYGVPDIPEAFVCVTSFTPQNLVGGSSGVTVPRVCAGDCYGPVTVPVPVSGGGSGQVAVITYNGQTYPIVVGQVPPLPPLPPVNTGPDGQCDGEPAVFLPPFLCAYADRQGVLVQTCVVGPCRSEYVDHGDYTENVIEAVARIFEDPVEAVCRSRC